MVWKTPQTGESALWRHNRQQMLDDELSAWLDNYEFKRCLSSGSIWTLKKGEDSIVLINAVDDQLYFSTSDALRKKFEKDISDQFDVDLLGQAH